jgi:hypothetical protein
MHPIVIYVMFKTRMELDREAERRRLARTDMPRVLPAPADGRPPRKKWRAAMSIHRWIGAPSGDRGQPNRIGDIGFPHAVAESRCAPVGADTQAVAARRAAHRPLTLADRRSP